MYIYYTQIDRNPLHRSARRPVCDIIALALAWGKMESEHAAFLRARKAWRDGFKQHGFGSTNERWKVVTGTK